MINAPKESILKAGLDASDYTRGAQEIDRANTEISASSGLVEQSQEKMTRSLVSSSSSMDRLQASLDKGFASQLRYEQIVDRVNSAMERGRISQERGAQIISLAQQRYMSAATATAAMGAATAAAATSGRSFGAVAQQAGYQIGDFASQVAAGGSAVTAFVQQGSQMLGMFGMFGAVAGAALAIGGVAYQMYAARDAAKATKTEIELLVDEIERLNEETKKAVAPTPRLGASLEIAKLQGEIARLRASAPTQTSGGGGMMGDLGVGNEANVVGAGRAADKIAELTKKLEELTKAEQANRVALLYSDDAYNATGQGIADLIQLREEAARKAEEEARATEIATQATIQSVIEGLDPAARATREYESRLTYLGLALQAGAIDQERYSALVNRAADDLDRAKTSVDRHAQALDEQARRVREQLDPVVAYARELEQLNELLNTGRLTHEEYARAADQSWSRLNRTTSDTRDIARDLGLTFESAFEDAIVKGQGFRSVLGGIIQDIGRLVLRQTVTAPLAGLASSFFGGLFAPAAPASWAMSPTDLGLPGFANGGPVVGNRPIVVGEEGPEVFVPSSAGTIVPNGVSMGGGVTVHQTINISTGVAQTVRAEIAALMPAIKRQTVDAVADARMRGGSFAAAMGT
jgi:hypothetical protein